MGRRYQYFCDECGRNFGETDHINIKEISAFVSHKNRSWQAINFLNVGCGQELHFCNSLCFSHWFIKKYEKKREKIHTLELNGRDAFR